MSTERDERTRQLWHQCYLAGEHFMEATATWTRACATDPDGQEANRSYATAKRDLLHAKAILRDLLEQAGLPEGGVRLVDGADGLLMLSFDAPMAVWMEAPIDLRPVRPPRLWDGRQRRITVADALPTVEVTP